MRYYRRVLPLPLLLLSICLLTACPKQTDLDRMAKASNELAHDTLLANKVVAEFYKAGKIPTAQKDKIADLLGRIGEKGNVFNNTLIELDKKYPEGTVPPDTLTFLRNNFSELRALFTAVFDDLKVFHAEGAVSKLDSHLNTIGEVLNK